MEEIAQRHGPIPRILEPKQTPENSPPASSAYSPTPPTFTALMARTPKARIGLLRAKLSPPPPRHQPWKTSPQATSWEPAPPSGPPSTRPAGKSPPWLFITETMMAVQVIGIRNSTSVYRPAPTAKIFQTSLLGRPTFSAQPRPTPQGPHGPRRPTVFQQPQSIHQRLPTRLPAESTETPPP